MSRYRRVVPGPAVADASRVTALLAVGRLGRALSNPDHGGTQAGAPTDNGSTVLDMGTGPPAQDGTALEPPELMASGAAVAVE